MVPPDSHGISGVPCYLGYHSRATALHLRGYHPLRRHFPMDFNFNRWFLTLRTRGRQVLNGPTTPHTQPLPGITRMRFSLFRFRSPLLSESLLFSLPVGTEMFHFPTFPPHALYIQARVTGHDSSWVSPFGHPRITARLPTPQGLSQAPTSFIGSRCQGIHHVPFIACLTNTTQQQLLQRCSRPLCRSQTTSPPTTNPTPSPCGSAKGGTKQPDNHPHSHGSDRPDPSGPNSVPPPPHPSPTRQVPHPPPEAETWAVLRRDRTPRAVIHRRFH